jgi:hypothetical protein
MILRARRGDIQAAVALAHGHERIVGFLPGPTARTFPRARILDSSRRRSKIGVIPSAAFPGIHRFVGPALFAGRRPTEFPRNVFCHGREEASPEAFVSLISLTSSGMCQKLEYRIPI